MSDFAEELQSLSATSPGESYRRAKAAIAGAQDSLKRVTPNNPLLKLIVLGESSMEFCPGSINITPEKQRTPGMNGFYLVVDKYVRMLNEETEAIRQSC
jgi:hypothetical protein